MAISSTDYSKYKSLARKLRNEGFSYSEIRVEVPVSKSTISLWCSDIKLSPEQKERLRRKGGGEKGAQFNKRKALQVRADLYNRASCSVNDLDRDTLLVAGAMLYWAEGAKTVTTAFSNSDAAMVLLYVKWLHEVFGVNPNKLQAHLHLHKNQNEVIEKEYWSKLTSIPIKNFGKTYFKKKGTGHRKNKLPHGTIRIRMTGTGSSLTRIEIFGLIDGILRQFKIKDTIIDDFKHRMGR